MHGITERFIEALEVLHDERQVGPLVSLFAPDAELHRAGETLPLGGGVGVEEFWLSYREVFAHVETTFGHTVTGEDVALLEWVSEGSLTNGADFRYTGVSVLEGDEQSLTGFRSYYDSAIIARLSSPRHGTGTGTGTVER